MGKGAGWCLEQLLPTQLVPVLGKEPTWGRVKQREAPRVGSPHPRSSAAGSGWPGRLSSNIPAPIQPSTASPSAASGSTPCSHAKDGVTTPAVLWARSWLLRALLGTGDRFGTQGWDSRHSSGAVAGPAMLCSPSCAFCVLKAAPLCCALGFG